VREGETGYVVDGRDEHAVADRLIALLSDADLRARMGAAGRAWAERDWPWAVVAGHLTEMLQG